MPERRSFDYAVIRIVPRPEREEFVNAGVILFCLADDYLAARVHLDPERLRALWPALDPEILREHLEAIPRICAGAPGSGPIGALSRRERFHWLVAPRSTVLQVSAVHSGLCESPQAALDRLFDSLVALPAVSPESGPPHPTC